MFNKKLKEENKKFEKENKWLWNQLNDFSWKQEEAEAKEKALNKSVKDKEVVISNLEEVIEAQAVILKAFAEFIVGLDEKEPSSPKGKKCQKKGKK